MEDLHGRIALVTGASRGIGRAIAIALARAGVDVAINYQSRGSDAEAARAEIELTGRRAITVQADVSIAAEVARLVHAVEAALGPIDILVNNAGIARPQKIKDIGEADWDDVLRVNLKSCYLVSQAVLPGR